MPLVAMVEIPTIITYFWKKLGSCYTVLLGFDSSKHLLHKIVYYTALVNTIFVQIEEISQSPVDEKLKGRVSLMAVLSL